MPQGKLKVKTKVPTRGAKNKTPAKAQAPKTPAVSRKSRPLAAKKGKNQVAQKLKKVITKNVNKNAEDELRQVANVTNKISSKKGKAAKGKKAAAK